MPFQWNPREHAALGAWAMKWLAIAAPVGAVVGSAVALFLWSLDRVTAIRWATDTPSGLPWLLFLLPVAGLAAGALYHWVGGAADRGNNLIIEEIHEPDAGVPLRMAPLVLVGTLVTHLFGGSAGREGTAVQMGASLASGMGRWIKLDRADVQILLMCGMAAGFGAVFGTPLAGAVFAIEVATIGLMSVYAVVPCLIAAVAGDSVATAWGIRHTHYDLSAFAQAGAAHAAVGVSWPLLGKVAIASIAFGLAGVLFAEAAHTFHALFKRFIAWAPARPAMGGLIVLLLAWLVGPDYLGLGVSADPHHPNQVSILSCFHPDGAHALSWWWKILFTAVTVSSGFKGGEVTPLFFIGAALGNALAGPLGAPVDLLAALGFVAVFAGATNTPLACTLMGIELFVPRHEGLLGGGFGVYLAVACFLSYLLSGHTGIYLSQRIGTSKLLSRALSADATIGSLRSARARPKQTAERDGETSARR